MTTERRAPSAASVAIAGGLIALALHALTYLVFVPASHFGRILTPVDHAFGLGTLGAIVAIGVALVLLRAGRPAAEFPASVALAALRGVVVGAVAFVALETGERLVLGTSLRTMLEHHVLIVLAIQVAAMLLIAAFVTALVRFVERVLSASPVRRAMADESRGAIRQDLLPRRAHLRLIAVRGPPGP